MNRAFDLVRNDEVHHGVTENTDGTENDNRSEEKLVQPLWLLLRELRVLRASVVSCSFRAVSFR